MSVHLYQHKFSYFAVPKCACTSLKQYLFRVENGFPFRRYWANGKGVHIHSVYPTLAFEGQAKLSRDDHFKVAFIRDPLSRIVSCFRNRVAPREQFPEGFNVVQLRRSGLPEKPTLSEFVERLDDYREASDDIRHHSQPLSHFLGTSPDYYDLLLTLGEMDRFIEEVKKRADAPDQMPRSQIAGPQLSVKDLDDTDTVRIKTKYAEDYELYGSYFEAA